MQLHPIKLSFSYEVCQTLEELLIVVVKYAKCYLSNKQRHYGVHNDIYNQFSNYRLIVYSSLRFKNLL